MKKSSFNDIIKYFEVTVLSTFNKSNKSIKDFQISCESINVDYLLSVDIDRTIKMKQLRTMYLDDSEIDRINEQLHNPYVANLTYYFNDVGGKENSTHHKKGGCITHIDFQKSEYEIYTDIYFRASVAPYNLYFDLIMLNELFKKLGFKEDSLTYYKFTFHFKELKGKLMQNFFYYISAGFYDNKEEFLKHEYAQMMLEEYNKAENASYHSTKRFWGKCNDAMRKRGIENGK